MNMIENKKILKQASWFYRPPSAQNQGEYQPDFRKWCDQ